MVRKRKSAMSDGAAVFRFNVTDLVWFYDTENPTDPNPAPGVVTEANGENDFTVEITLADDSTRTEKHVGAVVSGSVRWIETRDRNAGQL